MSTAIITTLCILLLIAYVFDYSSSRTKIPSVILLLILGVVVKQLSVFFELTIPPLQPILPILGTIGLILIVLEGSLELEFNSSKKAVIIKSFFLALLPMLLLAGGLTFMLNYIGGYSIKQSLLNAIPICVISSSIAIPSVRGRSAMVREFVIYETSLSDILGVLFLNFIVLNSTFGLATFGNFGLQILIITAISFIATIGMAFLLGKIDHHIKFAPIIILVILIYELSKIYHLPGLIFILVLGLFLGNFDEMKNYRWVQRLQPELLNREVKKFKEIVAEATFLIKTLFFLLFGYLIDIPDVLNPESFLWALGIVTGIFLIRIIFLKIANLPLKPLLFVAPRGLITILLFLAIPAAQAIPEVNKSLIIQIIVLTALVMMFGLMFSKNLDKPNGKLTAKEVNGEKETHI